MYHSTKADQNPLHVMKTQLPGRIYLVNEMCALIYTPAPQAESWSLVQLRTTAQERPKAAPEELPHSSKPIWENLLICSHT